MWGGELQLFNNAKQQQQSNILRPEVYFIYFSILSRPHLCHRKQTLGLSSGETSAKYGKHLLASFSSWKRGQDYFVRAICGLKTQSTFLITKCFRLAQPGKYVCFCHIAKLFCHHPHCFPWPSKAYDRVLMVLMEPYVWMVPPLLSRHACC